MTQFSIYTDGGARGNPGPAALGVVVMDGTGQVVKEFIRYLGEATNNQAEYKALIAGLEQVSKLAHPSQVSLRAFLDSELVVKQMNGEYRVKDEHLKPLFAKAQKLSSTFKQVVFIHIRRERNAHADSLVNRALDARK